MGTATWTRENLRHVLAVLRQGRNPAATVYESIGTDFFLALSPGWLNLGLWEGGGEAEEAPAAARRLVETLAADLPRGGVVLDVGNGLGVQDPVVADVARPRRLVALNITERQLRAGRPELERAGATGVAADACRIPLARSLLPWKKTPPVTSASRAMVSCRAWSSSDICVVISRSLGPAPLPLSALHCSVARNALGVESPRESTE